MISYALLFHLRGLSSCNVHTMGHRIQRGHPRFCPKQWNQSWFQSNQLHWKELSSLWHWYQLCRWRRWWCHQLIFLRCTCSWERNALDKNRGFIRFFVLEEYWYFRKRMDSLFRGSRALGEKLQGRESWNVESAAERSVLICIYFGNYNIFLFFKRFTNNIIFLMKKKIKYIREG